MRRFLPSANAALAIGAALVLCGATCGHAGGGDAPSLGALPLDFERQGLEALAPGARAELTQAANDELCPCGCPHTLAECLATHAACGHARRALSFAAEAARSGARASEIIRDLKRYYDAFRPEGRKPIDLSRAACKGPGDAPVTVVEFSDFQCPFCAQAASLVDALVTQFGARVRLCFRHFPLAVHENAAAAAEAAEFAQARGRFWELHDLIFDSQGDLSRSALASLGGRAGLDPSALDRALAAGTFAPAVEASKAEGKRLGVEGTPSFFVNGRPLDPSLGASVLARAIEDELEHQASGGWKSD